jgi:hypothetical protein
VNVVFENPHATWALLGLPAVIAIHFLQERARKLRTSTLFLLEHLAPESRGGVHFDRLRQSLPMWLQLLAVLLIAWVLAGPRWMRSDSRQAVVIVLDDAISMSAYLPETRALIASRLHALNASAAHTDWTLLESDLAQPALYHGAELPLLLDALAKWQPQLGTHDPAPALRLAQSLVRGEGLVIFATNHQTELPGGVAVLSAAKPLANCGFTAATVTRESGAPIWHALIKNYGTQTQTRAWRVHAGATDSPKQSITLQPGEALTVEGPFPPGAERCELRLDDDAFAVDNTLPVLIPKPKSLTVAITATGDFADSLAKVVNSIPNTRIGTLNVEVAMSLYDPAAPVLEKLNSIEFPAPGSSAATPAAGWVLAADHPLMDGLNWSGLLAPHLGGLQTISGDEPLLWHGSEPLIVLRHGEKTAHLLFNFAPEDSNAMRLPAFVLLIRRFLETIRETKISAESLNTDTHQPLAIACDPQGALTLTAGSRPAQILPASAVATLRAPALPGFFTVKQGDALRLEGAAQFADPREADLSTREPLDTVGERAAQLVKANTASDPLTPLWLLLIVAALLGSWAAPRRFA